jgi:hypothetical protein
VDEAVAAVPSQGALRALATASAGAVSGAVLGAGALLGAVLSVLASDDRAAVWMLVALIVPTVGCRFAWSRVETAWSSSSKKVRYHVIRTSRAFVLVRQVCSFWTLLAPAISVGALVWLVLRLADGATGWLGLAVPLVVGAGLAALSVTLTVLSDDREHAFMTYAMLKWVSDGYVEKELTKSPYLGGSADWNSFWLDRIDLHTKEPPVDCTAQDCVDYIVTARAAAGLPPLEGLEP